MMALHDSFTEIIADPAGKAHKVVHTLTPEGWKATFDGQPVESLAEARCRALGKEYDPEAYKEQKAAKDAQRQAFLAELEELKKPKSTQPPAEPKGGE